MTLDERIETLIDEQSPEPSQEELNKARTAVLNSTLLKIALSNSIGPDTHKIVQVSIGGQMVSLLMEIFVLVYLAGKADGKSEVMEDMLCPKSIQ